MLFCSTEDSQDYHCGGPHGYTFISSSRDNCAVEMPHLPELLPVLAIPSSYSLPSPALSLLPLLLR